MMNSFEGLADEISTLLKNRGCTGDKLEKTSPINIVSVTPRRISLSPHEIEGCQPVQSMGDGKGELDQLLGGGVTRVTRVTRDFEHARKVVAWDLYIDQGHLSEAEFREPSEALPSSWTHGLARLRAMEIPDGFTAERWRYIVDDAAAFLNQWGVRAANLGWSIHDLFGVHPVAPAVRFDAMGLIPLLNGDPVVALSETTATVRKVSGSIPRFRRTREVQSICLWEIG